MAPKRYPADSTYFVRVAVSGRAVDPDSDTAELALRRDESKPAEKDWNKASWKSEDGRMWARLLVGTPSKLVLERSRWQVWLRVTTGSDRIIRNVGVIDVI